MNYDNNNKLDYESNTKIDDNSGVHPNNNINLNNNEINNINPQSNPPPVQDNSVIRASNLSTLDETFCETFVLINIHNF